MKYIPSILDNVKYWKVFEDKHHINFFLEMVDEFSTIHINQEDDKYNDHIN